MVCTLLSLVTSQDNNRLKMNIQIVCMVFFSVYANVHCDCEDIVLSLTYTWPQEPAGYDRIAKVAVPETQPGEKVPVVFDLHGIEI